MTDRIELSAVRLTEGARNYIRVGDPVKVKPSQPGKQDGYIGIIKRISRPDIPDGKVEIDVIGGPANKPVFQRAFLRERLERVVRTTTPTHRQES